MKSWKQIKQWFDDGSKKCDMCERFRPRVELNEFTEYQESHEKWNELVICDGCYEIMKGRQSGSI